MSKYSIKFEIQGLKIEVEGTKDDAPQIAKALGQRVAGLLDTENTNGHNVLPASRVIEGEVVSRSRKKPSRKSSTSNSASSTTGGDIVEWKHDPDKWGNPIHGWSTSKKCLWLLYVAEGEGFTGGMNSTSIARTFNQHFKDAGQIQVFNINRDLGNLKSKSGAPVGQDTTGGNEKWFLTQTGKKKAEALVNESKGQVAA